MNPPDGYRIATTDERDCLPKGTMFLNPVTKGWVPSAYEGSLASPEWVYAVPITEPTPPFILPQPPDGYRMATAAELDCLPEDALMIDPLDPADTWNSSSYCGDCVPAECRVLVYAVPVTPPATGIEAQVCADIAARQQRGIQKYGTTVQDNPLPLKAWLQHAYEEALDHAIYLKRAIAEL